MLWPRGANIIYVAWVASVQTPLCRRMRSKQGSSANLSYWLSTDFCTFSIVFRHFYGKTFCILSVDTCICAFILCIYIYRCVCVSIYTYICFWYHFVSIYTLYIYICSVFSFANAYAYTQDKVQIIYTDSSIHGSFSMHTCTYNRHTLLAPRKSRVLTGGGQKIHLKYDSHSPPRDRCIT